ncbi:MAG: YegS/Rv2252/BmrU family lipid kinase [Bacteroidetes bacterium]|jgi:YegS/Rv2252/BmrU family lipid kinase|nr:YegS/Rv2252/BmrU family lipid kinase [Bacteroidota bacterium]
MIESDRRISFIINPASDNSRSARHINWIREEAEKRWGEFEITIIKEHDRISDLASLKARKFDTVVACGGDGTVSKVVNGIAKQPVNFGVLPVGSGNDFVKSLHLNRPLPECMDILAYGATTQIDLIKIEGDKQGWCANTIGLGLDGLANYYAHQISSGRGPMTYFRGAVKAIFSFRGSRIQLLKDDSTQEQELLMVTACNGKWEGGTFFVAPEADMQDGYMDLLIIEKIPVYKLIPYLIHFRKGPHKNMKGVRYSKAESIEIRSEKMLTVHSDGENLGTEINHLKLSIEREALRVIVPKNFY